MSLAIDFWRLMHYISPMGKVIMAGSARPDTVNFSEHNSRGGCSTENGKRKTENFPEPAIAAGLKRGKEINRAWRFPDGYREILLPVRKSLTKKSGIIGLPTGAGQDSLVYDGRG
jgi:hypothetical protein